MTTLTRSSIVALLASSQRAVYTALVRIGERQTEDELRGGVTSHTNSKGFTGSDSAFLTDMYRIVTSGRLLSVRQFNAVQRAMPKYWKQLLEEAALKGHDVSYNRDK